MSVEEVTAVEEVQELFWQAAGIAVPWWVLGWEWAAAPPFKQTQGAVLGQAQQIQVVAWEGRKHHVEVWAVPALKGQGTWSPQLIGPMLVKAGGITTKLDTTMWVKVPAVS